MKDQARIRAESPGAASLPSLELQSMLMEGMTLRMQPGLRLTGQQSDWSPDRCGDRHADPFESESDDSLGDFPEQQIDGLLDDWLDDFPRD